MLLLIWLLLLSWLDYEHILLNFVFFPVFYRNKRPEYQDSNLCWHRQPSSAELYVRPNHTPYSESSVTANLDNYQSNYQITSVQRRNKRTVWTEMTYFQTIPSRLFSPSLHWYTPQTGSNHLKPFHSILHMARIISMIK